jgi:hypothetical protein
MAAEVSFEEGLTKESGSRASPSGLPWQFLRRFGRSCLFRQSSEAPPEPYVGDRDAERHLRRSSRVRVRPAHRSRRHFNTGTPVHRLEGLQPLGLKRRKAISGGYRFMDYSMATSIISIVTIGAFFRAHL